MATATSRRSSVVLLQPLIPHNTGAIGRTCVGLGASLHLIEPLGFRLDDAAVKRAGLDYWPKLDVTVHANWEAYADAELTLGRKAFLLTRLGRYGEQSIFDTEFPQGENDSVALVFGSEVAMRHGVHLCRFSSLM